jgi:hypothetical protein
VRRFETCPLRTLWQAAQTRNVMSGGGLIRAS